MKNRPRLVCSSCALGVASWPRTCPYRETIFGSGQKVLTQGARPEHLWYLRAGMVLLTSTGADGNETFCAVREGPTLLGTELLRDAPSPYDARTLTAAVLCRLSAAELQEWLDQGNAPSRAVLGLVLEEMARRQDERTSLAGNASTRVARFLVARLDSSEDAASPLNRQNLARVLRMRPETLSRALKRLRSIGALGEAPGLDVRDEAVLRAVAAADPVGWSETLEG